MRNGKGWAHIHWSDELKWDSERQGANTTVMFMLLKREGKKMPGEPDFFLK